MTLPVILNLDTSRMRQLAASEARDDHASLLRLLGNGEAALAMCLPRLRELACTTPQVQAEVAQLIGRVPTLLCHAYQDVIQAEIAAAHARADGVAAPLPVVFSNSVSRWSGERQPGGAAEVFKELCRAPTKETDLFRTFEMMATANAAIGAKSLLAADTERSLVLMIAFHRVRILGGGSSEAVLLRAAELGQHAGGLSSFPLLEAYLVLMKARFVTPKPIHRNDVIDEHIFLYAPYSHVTVVDRGTAARVWRSGYRGRGRVIEDLSAVSRILANQDQIAPMAASDIEVSGGDV